MLTQKPTEKMIEQWKMIFDQYRNLLKPNRKSGTELNTYFKKQYDYREMDNTEFTSVVYNNIIHNEVNLEKLPKGVDPDIVTYATTLTGTQVLVGIDLISGYFYVESENTEKAIPIYDDLFVHRGLDEQDLQNYFLVAEYVKLSEV